MSERSSSTVVIFSFETFNPNVRKSSDICARPRLKLACTIEQSDPSVLSARGHFAALNIQNAPSEESDQTARILTWIFAGRTCPKVPFLKSWIIFSASVLADKHNELSECRTVFKLNTSTDNSYQPTRCTCTLNWARIRQNLQKTLVRPANTQFNRRIRISHRMYIIQPQDYRKRDTWKPLPYWMDIQADLSLCWSHRSYCRFCRTLALIISSQFTKAATWQNMGEQQNLGSACTKRQVWLGSYGFRYN